MSRFCAPFLFAVLIFLAACGRSEPMVIGFISGQTGAFSDLGVTGVNGAILAVEQRNAQGGIAGQPVRMLIRDDQHDPRVAKAGLQALIDEQVLAVVGSMTSAMTVEMIPLANAAGMVLMGGTVVTNKVSGQDDFFLRPIAPASAYAAYSAGVHWQRLQPSRVIVVFDLANRDYAEDWADSYAAALVQLGQVNVQKIAFDSRTMAKSDALLSKIIDGKPALVTFACSAKSTVVLMQQIRKQMPAVPFAVSGWAANQTLMEQGGEAAEGALVEQYHNLGDTSAKYLSFIAEYRQRFHQSPDYAAVVAFDATNIVLDGLQMHPRRQGLKQVLLKQKRFAGVQGEIEFDAYGDAKRQAYTTQVVNGHFQPLPALGGQQ